MAEQLTGLVSLVEDLAANPEVPAPKLGEAFGDLAQHYHAYGLAQVAEESYGIAARLAPEDFRWPYLQAYLLESAGQFLGHGVRGQLGGLCRRVQPRADQVVFRHEVLRSVASVLLDRPQASATDVAAQGGDRHLNDLAHVAFRHPVGTHGRILPRLDR